ncbi:endonuclease [Bacteroidales bacterium OttesenSCG-928-L03]|nr:endonuclease [Bacteroidales bacterium OttesenSCG-928-L03]
MLNKKFMGTLIALSILFSLSAQDIPEGYYDKIDQKKERELKTALHKILKDHVRLRYNDLWVYFRTTDTKGNNLVWDMYSNTTYYFGQGNSSSTSGMNKEHSFPKSWWAVSDEVDNYDAYSDLHHLYPADSPANLAKSNYILGEVTNITFNNGVSKVGKNAYSYSGSPNVNAFEPADEYKGDFARTYLYIITCYEDYANQWRSDGMNMLFNETYPVLKPWAKDMLLKWHRNDPVNTKEILRNEEVYKYQSNRNPYIDFPQLVDYIWGDSTTYTFTVPEQIKTGDPVLVTPPNGSVLYFGDIRKNSEISQTLILKGSSLTGNLRIYLWGGNTEYFSLPTATISSVLVNSEGGYKLEIDYNPKEYGEHETSLVISGGGLVGTYMVTLRGICSDGTPIIPIEADQPDLFADQDGIHFRTYERGSLVYIYSITGQLLYKGKGTADWETFLPHRAGVYLIRINNKIEKVVVN